MARHINAYSGKPESAAHLTPDLWEWPLPVQTHRLQHRRGMAARHPFRTFARVSADDRNGGAP